MTEGRSAHNGVWMYMLAAVIAIPASILLVPMLGGQAIVVILLLQIVCWLVAWERYVRQSDVELRSRAQKWGLILSGVILGLWTLLVIVVAPITIVPYGM